MPLTPDEILQRRLTDPYFGLAEELAQPSLAQQKGVSLAAATIEKNRRLDPAAAMADEAKLQTEKFLEGAEKVGLLDIAESSLYRGASNISDFVTGDTQDPALIQQQADERAGVTPEDRQRLVGDPQEAVIQSLAKGGMGYLEAIPQAIAAAPGTLADSAQVIPELAAGAALTAATRGVAGKTIFANRGKKLAEGISNVSKRVDKARDNLEALAAAKNAPALKGIVGAAPKAAGQVSIATADITQGQINEFTQKHGVEPTRAEAAGMFALNLATMMPTPSIIKNLFIPDFKKQVGKEIRTLGKNLGSGSNLKSIAGRVVDGTKKITTAAGAEAGQEYFQTWAENLNVGMGPKERETFFKSVMNILGDDDAQLQALAGAYLGGGAGGAARAAITAPAVAVGTAADTAKGTAKVAVKTAAAGVKLAGRGAQAVANKAAFKVLSDEEREVIRSEYNSRKEIVDQKVAGLELTAAKIQNAESAADLMKADTRIAELVEKANLTDDQLQDPKTFKAFKQKLVRNYKADAKLIQEELRLSNVAALAERAAKNIGVKSVDAAKAAMKAAAPTIEEAKITAKQYGAKAVKAVEEIKSSTALGIIEVAATAGKNETKAILKAAGSLDRADLVRVQAVVAQFNPDLAKKLKRVQAIKDKELERIGLKNTDIINSETLDPVIKDVVEVKKGEVDTLDVAILSSAINKTTGGVIQDLDTLDTIEAALTAVELSREFKNQIDGAMTETNMRVVKQRLAKVRAKLEAEENSPAGKAKKAAKAAAKTMKEAADPVVKKAKAKIADAFSDAEPTEVNIGPKLENKISLVKKVLENPDEIPDLITGVPAFANSLKKAGITSRAQYVQFIEDNPELESSVEFMAALDEHFPSDISADEFLDNVKTMGINTLDKIKEAYNNMNPPECKV